MSKEEKQDRGAALFAPSSSLYALVVELAVRERCLGRPGRMPGLDLPKTKVLDVILVALYPVAVKKEGLEQVLARLSQR